MQYGTPFVTSAPKRDTPTSIAKPAQFSISSEKSMLASDIIVVNNTTKKSEENDSSIKGTF